MGDSDEVISLTPLIMTLPGVASVISCSPPACPFAAAKLLVKGVSKKFSESQVKIGCESFFLDTYLKDISEVYNFITVQVHYPLVML